VEGAGGWMSGSQRWRRRCMWVMKPIWFSVDLSSKPKQNTKNARGERNKVTKRRGIGFGGERTDGRKVQSF
jgi:hypothetical protein